MRWTGQIFWLLAFGACAASHLLPAFTPEKNFQGLAQWEVVSSYSSATAPDSHGISCADPLFQARKELDREVAARARHCKNYFRFILSVCPRTSDRVQQLSHRLKAFPLAWRKLEESRRGFRPQ